MQQKPQNSRVG